ncbi:preprotein translocase subunit SecE [Coxiella endosymbiont of Amblyomma americanum]|uniref:preprotein translocase subunit SecE n=1 Tax=Coxiella endosymbiont of Amblyomma americanum TaxID=325775 RepID=UPI00057F5CCB|nr:preprotein translocase subunit SecE [Coxiella endosymbiont of Amblyomma americanum]AJC50410.1 preprotein translocase subunit SecE [Coxiella endosymbiont of Amblyomma americanum]AUJ58751.1 preprotein translocase subunit SecE [Coxiella-like endosymbiont of Amblyomma americanum]
MCYKITKSCFDTLKWILVAILIAVWIIVNFYRYHTVLLIRAAVEGILFVLVLLIAVQTRKGREVWGFVKDARMELRKVIWPTRQETIRVTMVVVAMVVVTALVLWSLDSFFMWVIAWITA